MQYKTTVRACARGAERGTFLPFGIQYFPPRTSSLLLLRQTRKHRLRTGSLARQHHATPALRQEEFSHEDYPGAPPGLFTDPSNIDEWKSIVRSSKAPTRRVLKLADGYKCRFQVTAANDAEYEVVRDGPSEEDVIRDTGRDMLAELHNNGVLRELFPNPVLQVERYIPTHNDYPEAPPDLFRNPASTQCWSWLFPQKVSREMIKARYLHICIFKVTVSEKEGELQYKTVGRATSALDAALAATQSMLSKLHSNGILGARIRELATAGPSQRPLDTTYIARLHEDYPNAPGLLFTNPAAYWPWEKHIIMPQTFDMPYVKVRDIKYHGIANWNCSFNVMISRNVTYTTLKFSSTREHAVLLAAQDMLVKLHEDGILKELFQSAQPLDLPQPVELPSSEPQRSSRIAILGSKDDSLLLENSDTRQGTENASNTPSENTSSLETSVAAQSPNPTSVKHSNGLLPSLEALDNGQEHDSTCDLSSSDPERLLPADSTESQTALQDRAEKEHARAMSSVYDLCAALLETPEFDVQLLESIGADTRMYKATIRFPTLDIYSEGLGNYQRAVFDASDRFKKAFERHYHDYGESLKHLIINQKLNTVNAKKFVLFYNDRYPEAQMSFAQRVVIEPPELPEEVVRVYPTLNGERAGDDVVAFPFDVLNIVHLLAGIHLAKQYPALFRQFADMQKPRRGIVFQAAQQLRLSVRPKTLSLMTTATNSIFENITIDDEVQDDDHGSLRRFTRHPKMSLAYAENQNQILRDRYQALLEDQSHAALRRTTVTHPIHGYRSLILDLVRDNVYSIINAATGSGKTTLVPQIILDDAICRGEGSQVNILCTQPRRIAAISVAESVAKVRKEKLQESVGYHIRDDVKLPKYGGSITYATTGILPKLLQHYPDQVMDRLSHIVLDEVHERNSITDFLFILLKKSIDARQQVGKPVPKIVIMSATMNIELFASYFSQVGVGGAIVPCPSLAIPGRNFRVDEMYLEDILTDLAEAHSEQKLELLCQDQETKQFVDLEKSLIEQSSLSEDTSDIVIDRMRSSELDAGLSLVPVGLIALTVAHIVQESTSGAILVFLPGLSHIVDVKKLLTTTNPLGVNFDDPAKFKILVLCASAEVTQDDPFAPEKDGCRKIILATNIAETSITIPDVKFVVDSGKHNERTFDQLSATTRLQCTWISDQNLQQRSGRAGRVQDGRYYALFSKARRNTFRISGIPEILRSDLQDLCLDVTAQSFNIPINDFLAAAIEPPSSESVEVAIQRLKELEAITESERLTALGRVLASLPVRPELGKLILLGTIFRCFDSLLIVGAAADEQPLLARDLEDRVGPRKAWHEYSQGSNSDAIAMINAFRDARRLAKQGRSPAMYKMKFLRNRIFKAINRKMLDIEEVLQEAGVIPRCPPHERQEFRCGHPSLNENSDNLPLLKALTFAGSPRNLASPIREVKESRLLRSETGVSGLESFSVNSVPRTLRGLREKRYNATDKGDQWKDAPLIYSFRTMEKSPDGSKTYLRDSTGGTTLMAAIFGRELRHEKLKKVVVNNEPLIVNGWLPLALPAHSKIPGTILEFRKALDLMLTNAFSSLARRDHNIKNWADDPLRKKFASALTAILEDDEMYQNPTLRQAEEAERFAEAISTQFDSAGLLQSPASLRKVEPFDLLAPRSDRT